MSKATKTGQRWHLWAVTCCQAKPLIDAADNDRLRAIKTVVRRGDVLYFLRSEIPQEWIQSGFPGEVVRLLRQRGIVGIKATDAVPEEEAA